MIYFYNDIDATNSIRISNSEIAELDLVAKIKESDLDKYLKKYLKKDTNVWFYYDLSDLAEDYDCQYVQNDEFGLWYTDENIVESKKSARKSIRESNRTKLDIIKDMVDLAYDVKRQSKIDKDSYFGNQPNSVINAKDDKVYEKFVDLAEKLKLHGWNQFIDYAYDLIDEYENVIEESKESARKSIKESSFSFVTVNDFCKHCATNYKHCEIWSVDGHHKYDEFDNLNKSNKSPYKYHEIMMWDVQNDTIILYIENNALTF